MVGGQRVAPRCTVFWLDSEHNDGRFRHTNFGEILEFLKNGPGERAFWAVTLLYPSTLFESEAQR